LFTRSVYLVHQLFEASHLLPFLPFTIDIVKRGSSSFSASSVAKGSIVLSKAIEKQFALEAEISRLRNHVSVLSKRLHSVTLEKQILEDIVKGGGAPLQEEVADEEAAPSVAGEELQNATGVVAGEELVSATGDVAGEELVDTTESVAGEEMMSATDDVAGEEEDDEVPEMAEDYNRFAMDLVEEKEPEPPVPAKKLPISKWTEEMKDRYLGRVKEEKEKSCQCPHRDKAERPPSPLCPSYLTRVTEERGRQLEETGEWPGLGAPVSGKEIVKSGRNTTGEERRLGSSGYEDAVIGGVIVAGGASTKRKNAARWKKRKLLREEEKEKPEYYKGWVPL